jgi:phosphoribosylformylglycinamidine cyclo-ligase
VAREELRRVFNCGVGYLVVVPAGEAERTVETVQALGTAAWTVGEVTAGEGVRYA